jgi:hypothetical protein
MLLGLLASSKLSRRPFDFEERLLELRQHMRGDDGLVKPREIRRQAATLLEVSRSTPPSACAMYKITTLAAGTRFWQLGHRR